jgi:hypothetical protein
MLAERNARLGDTAGAALEEVPPSDLYHEASLTLQTVSDPGALTTGQLPHQPRPPAPVHIPVTAATDAMAQVSSMRHVVQDTVGVSDQHWVQSSDLLNADWQALAAKDALHVGRKDATRAMHLRESHIQQGGGSTPDVDQDGTGGGGTFALLQQRVHALLGVIEREREARNEAEERVRQLEMELMEAQVGGLGCVKQVTRYMHARFVSNCQKPQPATACAAGNDIASGIVVCDENDPAGHTTILHRATSVLVTAAAKPIQIPPASQHAVHLAQCAPAQASGTVTASDLAAEVNRLRMLVAKLQALQPAQLQPVFALYEEDCR